MRLRDMEDKRKRCSNKISEFQNSRPLKTNTSEDTLAGYNHQQCQQRSNGDGPEGKPQ